VIPAVVYVFATGDTLTAVIFLIWSIVIFLIWSILIIRVDNVLKPLFIGRGVDVPMGVIFLGAIGGLLLSGIVGLFVGAIVLALGYKLFQAWLNREPVSPQTDLKVYRPRRAFCAPQLGLPGRCAPWNNGFC
jgi:predicted PurR-regulated permease PerM